jgi:hypothetical protein
MANLMQEPGAASEWIARAPILIVPGKKAVADKPKMIRPLGCLLLRSASGCNCITGRQADFKLQVHYDAALLSQIRGGGCHVPERRFRRRAEAPSLRVL